MSTVGFLHTAAVHVPVFESLVSELASGSSTTSVVDESLLAGARVDGPADPRVTDGIERALATLKHSGADVVVCTCSTIGARAEQLGPRCGVDVIRVDRPMVERAVELGERIAVVAAVDSTVEPTLALIESVAAERSRRPEVTVHLLTEAWPLFEAGDLEGYLALIASQLPAIAASCDVVVLAQASMAGAADLIELVVPILASPRTAIESLVGAGVISPGRRDAPA